MTRNLVAVEFRLGNGICGSTWYESISIPPRRSFFLRSDPWPGTIQVIEIFWAHGSSAGFSAGVSADFSAG